MEQYKLIDQTPFLLLADQQQQPQHHTVIMNNDDNTNNSSSSSDDRDAYDLLRNWITSELEQKVLV